jgi:SpoVK/Ycf46/Vps4 family AAA+-type ATPase
MIARAIASRAECTFLNISSSSLMSKWVGEGEKMVRCLFAVAAVKQPSVVFIDEIDSLLSLRSEGEMDAVRRVKTEFLVQLDGVGTNAASRVLLIGATNRPEELDEAARRRLEKRLYIPLPELESRRELVSRLMSKDDLKHSLTIADFEAVAAATDGYSGADLSALCREAAMGPLRAVMGTAAKVSIADIRPVCLKDFTSALKRQKPSVGKNEVQRYLKWNAEYGSFDLTEDD